MAHSHHRQGSPRFLERLHLDRSLAFVLVTKLWQVISGPITIALVVGVLTINEQGIYYGIIVIVGIQAFFELGLLNVLISQAGHEAAGLGESMDTARRDAATIRMAELIRASRRWFGGAGLVFLVTAMMFGWFTFAGSDAHQWLPPLCLAVALSAVSVYLSPSIAILEGSGQREDVYRYRCLQIITGSFAVWLGLALGWKLWVLPLSAAVQAGWMLYISRIRYAHFFDRFADVKEVSTDFSWRRDVVPIQWRTAVVSIVFHFATQLFTVIVIKFQSPTAAAPLGMTMMIVSAIQMLALAWIQTKYPVVSALHGDGKREQAGTVWRQIGVLSTIILLAGMATLMSLVGLLPTLESWIDKPLANRFLSVGQVATFAVGVTLNHLIALQSFYVLSRRAKPLVWANVIGYGSVAVAVWVGGYVDGVDGLLRAFAASMMFIAMPVHTTAYLRFRSRGQRTAEASIN